MESEVENQEKCDAAGGLWLVQIVLVPAKRAGVAHAVTPMPWAPVTWGRCF